MKSNEKKLNKKIDELFKHNDISVARIQTIFEVGYSRAARLLDKLEEVELINVTDKQKREFNKSKINKTREYIFNYFKDCEANKCYN